MSREREPGSNQPAVRSSRILLLVLVGIIIAGIAGFLLLRPNPSGAPTTAPGAHQ